MALMNLIEFVDEEGGEMVHRIPEQGSGEFKVGSQLIVRENQWAVFFRDGKAYDVFGAGRHTLATQNIPLLTALITTPLFGDTPFRSEAYFVSQRTFTDLKWGTSEPVLFRDSEFKMIRLRSNGIYSFHITDPKLFVMNIVGTRSIFTNGQIEDFLRGIIIGRLPDDRRFIANTPDDRRTLESMTKHEMVGSAGSVLATDTGTNLLTPS